MIESKVYKCEVCGTTYADKDTCRECEAFHLRRQQRRAHHH